jgi:hypothetical protein
MAQGAAKAAVDYLPGVMIGSKKANALLVFLWSPTCQRCVSAYRDIVLPLLNSEVEDERLMVFLGQVTDGSAIDLDTGVLLYCMPKNTYGPIVRQYLESHVAGSTNVGKHKVELTAVELVARHRSTAAPTQCLSTRVAGEKRSAILEQTKEFSTHYRLDELPILVFNSQVVMVSSADEIRLMLNKVK